MGLVVVNQLLVFGTVIGGFGGTIIRSDIAFFG
jgi:hypothetical protein